MEMHSSLLNLIGKNKIFTTIHNYSQLFTKYSQKFPNGNAWLSIKFIDEKKIFTNIHKKTFLYKNAKIL
jgi:hypothetical protein